MSLDKPADNIEPGQSPELKSLSAATISSPGRSGVEECRTALRNISQLTSTRAEEIVKLQFGCGKDLVLVNGKRSETQRKCQEAGPTSLLAAAGDPPNDGKAKEDPVKDGKDKDGKDKDVPAKAESAKKPTREQTIGTIAEKYKNGPDNEARGKMYPLIHAAFQQGAKAGGTVIAGEKELQKAVADINTALSGKGSKFSFTIEENANLRAALQKGSNAANLLYCKSVIMRDANGQLINHGMDIVIFNPKQK